MKNKYNSLKLCLILLLMAASFKTAAQSLNVNWSETYGGSSFDHAMKSKKTVDGGFITVGISESTDKDITNPLGGEDIWIIKTNSAGQMEWQKSYGGSDYDRAFDIIQTPDNGYIVVGSTWSDDGDVSVNKGGADLWVFKIDSEGTLKWEKSFGGSSDDSAATIIATNDGNYAIGGTTSSKNGDVTNHKGDLDIWLLKITGSGDLLWQKTYGGSSQDWTKSIQETSDGGFVIAGTTRSTNGDVSAPIKWDDVWIVKTDSSGTIEWEKTFGGTDFEVSNAIKQTEDNGFIVAGYTWSTDGDVSHLYGNRDVWILKLDAQGSLEWEKTYGGSQSDAAYAIEIVDGGYVFQANSSSGDHDVTNAMGNDDVWLVKINTEGDMVWQQSFGGSGKDWAESLLIDSGSYIISGYTASRDHDISINQGATDFWIISVSEEPANEDPCTWTVVVQDPSYMGKEVAWELRGPDGEILLSGGPYPGDYYDEQSVESAGPVEFYISTIGTSNDNKPAYTVSNGNGVVATGVLLGGNEITYSGLLCSTPAIVEDYSCTDQSMTSEDHEVAYEIGGSDLNNRLAIDIPVFGDSFTLYGITVNFFASSTNKDFDFILYDDNNGQPGTEIDRTSSTILKATLLGDAFGRDLYEFELKYAKELALETGKRYWLELVTDEGAWEAVDHTPIGKGVAYFNDYSNGEWITDPTSEFIYSLMCSEPLSIDTLESFSFSFTYYPNPVEDILNLQAEKPMTRLVITDLSGREIMSLSTANKEKELLNLSHLIPGMYLVKVYFDDHQTKTFKILKNR